MLKPWHCELEKAMEKISITIGDSNNAMIDDIEHCIVFRVTNQSAEDQNTATATYQSVTSQSDQNTRYATHILPIHSYTDK